MTKGRSSAGESKKNEKSTTGQASPDKNQRSTTGQGPAERNEGTKTQSQGGTSSQQPAQTQTKAPETGKQNQTTGAAPQGQQQNQTSGTATQGQQNASQQSGGTVQSQAGVSITAQQQTNIQRSVLSASNVPRVNNVDFAIRTNTVVPSHVHVVAISTFPVLVEAFPRFRDDSFFVVEDDIVIVDRSHRIVDVVPAGPRTHFGHAGSSTTVTTIDLSETEIRQVQQVLIDRGFFRGRVDGHFGPETREALISFQRKQGFEASGKVDTRTIGALGLSGKISGNAQGQGNQPANRSGMQQPSGQSGTTGQAPTSQQNSSGQSNSPRQNQSQQQPANNQSGSAPQTTGQGDNKQPPATQGSGNMQSQPSSDSQKENRSNR